MATNKLVVLASMLAVGASIASCAYAQPTIPKEKIPSNLDAETRELFEQLYSDSPDVRAHAAQRISRAGPETAEAAIPFLVSMLSDEAEWEEGDPRCEVALLVVNERVADALGRIGEPAVEALIAALEDERPAVRRRAAQALGLAECSEAVMPLVALLKDADWHVRAQAANALRFFRDPRSLDPLILALGDEEGHVREAAGDSLVHAGQAASDALLEVARKGAADPRQATVLLLLGRMHEPRALELILAAFNSEDSTVRKVAAWAAGMLKDPKAFPGLIKLLDDPESRVRSGAAYSLGSIGNSDAVPHLIGALKDDHVLVRQASIRALQGIGDPRAIEPLIACFDDTDEENRLAALSALRKMTGQGFYLDADAWRAWWEKNKAEFLKED